MEKLNLVGSLVVSEVRCWLVLSSQPPLAARSYHRSGCAGVRV